MRLKVRQFNPSNIKEHRIILFVGRRGTGKSSLMRDIMYRVSDRVEFGVAMSPTEESLGTFRAHVPEAMVYSEFNGVKLDHMLSMQKELARKQKQRAVFVLLDDCMYDKKVLKGTGMRNLFMNGRHLKVTFMNAVQYIMDMGPDLRAQVDYVFALRESIISNKMKLWKYFFGMFERYEDFSRCMDRCTENFSALVLDNTARTNNLEDCVFWYRADLNVPPFKMGKPIFWKLAQASQKTELDRDREDREAHHRQQAEQQRRDRRITYVERQDKFGHVIEEDLGGGSVRQL